jgi:hypothetical protein
MNEGASMSIISWIDHIGFDVKTTRLSSRTIQAEGIKLDDSPRQVPIGSKITYIPIRGVRALRSSSERDRSGGELTRASADAPAWRCCSQTAIVGAPAATKAALSSLVQCIDGAGLLQAKAGVMRWAGDGAFYETVCPVRGEPRVTISCRQGPALAGSRTWIGRAFAGEHPERFCGVE